MKSSNKLSFRDRIARANSRGDFAAVFMMLPAVILLVVMSIYPFFWLFRYICYDYNGFNAYFTGAIVKPIQQMQRDIAEVKKNTAKL